MWLSRTGLIAVTLLLLSCATIAVSQWDKRYGQPLAREYQPQPTSSPAYYGQVRPLIEQRYTVCHGCYDAPCQLKMDSIQGILRGANPEKVYDGSRLIGASLTRMFEDADSTAQWRSKSFHPVINERANTAEANINAGVMAQLLLLKKSNPLPRAAILPDSFDFKLDKKQYCPKIENLADYAQAQSLWGMPYALPGLSDSEHALLMRWLAEGAPIGEEPPVPAAISQEVTRWETFLNGDSLKQQLASRYIFEHLFLAKLFFSDSPATYFRLVRSSTPPGMPIARISTARPFDDPGAARVYYRLWRDPSSVVAKNYMPYALNAARLQQWQDLFSKPDYTVSQLPSYAPEVASNPFVAFAELPIDSRYRFMLNDAQFTIMNFIKGPVCRGHVALNVIQNHFWVFFFDPKTQSGASNATFLQQNSKNLSLPAEVGNTFLPLSHWLKYAELQKEYLLAKANFVKTLAKNENNNNLDIIWNDNGGSNKNTALTIFRHNDSASVHQGLIGDTPKTAWIIGYPLLERIHYLLVAGFDVYGNVSHQFLSRVYMDFLRMEGEMNFIEFLPRETQQAEMADWYKDAPAHVQDYINLYQNQLNLHSGLRYTSANPKVELLQKLKSRVGTAAISSHTIVAAKLQKNTAAAFALIASARGPALSFIPQTTLIRVPELGVFSLLHNNAYTNLSSLFNEETRHIPAEDTLTIAQGIIGAYPNAFMLVPEKNLPDFAARINNLASEADYQALRDSYGIRRSHPDFWRFSDELHQFYRATEAKEAGLLDYNRLENR